MSRSGSVHGVASMDSASDARTESADLKALLTTLLDESEGRDDRAQLIAEVDALVSGVVEEFHREDAVAPPPEPAIVAVRAEEARPVAVTPQDSGRSYAGAPRAPHRVVARGRQPIASAPARRRLWPLGIGAGLFAVPTVIWLTANGDLSRASLVAAVDEPASAAAVDSAAESSLAPIASEATAALEIVPGSVTVEAASPLAPRVQSSTARAERRPDRPVSRAGAAPRLSVGADSFAPAPPSPPVARATVAPESARAAAPVEPGIEPGPASAPPAAAPRVSIPEPPSAETRSAPPVEAPAVVPSPPSPSIASARREPRLLSKVMPDYPAELRSARVGGVVRLALTIDAQGRVAKVQPIAGHELLRRQAMVAVEQWKYEPASDAGVPVATEVVVSFAFDPRVRR
jgi:periplasmic protein TonB